MTTDTQTSRTTVRHDDPAAFDTGLRRFFAYRDLGVAQASAGRFGAHMIRPVAGEHPVPQWHTHALEFQMVLVLRGWVEFEYADVGRVRLVAGSTVYQPPGMPHREIAHSEDLEMLEVTSPAQFETSIVDDPRLAEAHPGALLKDANAGVA